MKNLIVRDKFWRMTAWQILRVGGCLGLAGSSLRPGLPAGARWVLSAAWRWPGVGLSAGRAGDAGDAGGSCRRVVTSPLHGGIRSQAETDERASAGLYTIDDTT